MDHAEISPHLARPAIQHPVSTARAIQHGARLDMMNQRAVPPTARGYDCIRVGKLR
jgi:hypothetical protein